MLKNILRKVQEMQLKGFPSRQIVIGTYSESVTVTVFEKDYDEKEDGEVKSFTFYSFVDDGQNEKELNDLISYYG